jgi:hypothetical protein
LDRILKDRLDFIFPSSDIKTMTNMQKVTWYGGDGVAKAFDFLTKRSYGNQSIKQEEMKIEIRAQKVVDKKAGRRSGGRRETTLAFQVPDHHDSDKSSSPPPANQLSLTQKRPRALSSAVANDAPQHKKGKYFNTTSSEDILSSEDMESPQPKKSNKGKGKALTSGEDEDSEMSFEPSTSNKSEGEVLVPDSDADVEMSTEALPEGPSSMSPPP